jgi:hypothetical protein
MRTEDARAGGLLERVGAASGAVYVGLLIVGGSMMTSGTTDTTRPTGEQVLSNLRRTAESGSAKVGLALALLGFAAFAAFLGYLHGVLRRAEGQQRSWLPTAAVFAGISALVIKWGSGSFVGAAILRKDEISPDLARTLNDLDSAAFWTSWLPYAVFVGLTAVVILRTRFVPRGFGWVGLVLAVAGVATSASVDLQISDLGAAPYLLSVLWVLALSGVLAIRGPRFAVDAPVPAVPVAA